MKGGHWRIGIAWIGLLVGAATVPATTVAVSVAFDAATHRLIVVGTNETHDSLGVEKSESFGVIEITVTVAAKNAQFIPIPGETVTLKVGPDQIKGVVFDGKDGSDQCIIVRESGNMPLLYWGGYGLNSAWIFGGDSRLYGGPGKDSLTGGSGDDVLIGGRGEDKLKGYDGNDHIYGQDGMEIIGGRMSGNPESDGGNDRIFGGPGFDSIKESAGINFVLD